MGCCAKTFKRSCTNGTCTGAHSRPQGQPRKTQRFRPRSPSEDSKPGLQPEVGQSCDGVLLVEGVRPLARKISREAPPHTPRSGDANTLDNAAHNLSADRTRACSCTSNGEAARIDQHRWSSAGFATTSEQACRSWPAVKSWCEPATDEFEPNRTTLAAEPSPSSEGCLNAVHPSNFLSYSQVCPRRTITREQADWSISLPHAVKIQPASIQPSPLSHAIISAPESEARRKIQGGCEGDVKSVQTVALRFPTMAAHERQPIAS